MTTLIFIINLGLLVYIAFFKESKTHYATPQDDYYRPSTAKETLEELEAREYLKKKYQFIVPSYGVLNGQKIPVDRITDEMMTNPGFMSPEALGKWVKRQPQ